MSEEKNKQLFEEAPVLKAVVALEVPTVLSAAFAHLVRAEGYSRQASFGMAFGGILNIILEDYEIKNLNQRNPGKSRVWRLGSVSLTSTDAA